MTINSSGEYNRAAGRDLNENKIQIDQFDGRHTINIAIPSENKDERPLVKAQRIELNRLVGTIVDLGAGEAYEVWQKLHAEIGVSSIEDMTVNQYHTAVSFLQVMLERVKENEGCRAMIHLLLKNTDDSVARQKLLRYCHFNFGTGRLNNLSLSQLQSTLHWFYEQKIQSGKMLSHSNLPMIATLTSNYPRLVLSAVFVVGLLVGRYII